MCQITTTKKNAGNRKKLGNHFLSPFCCQGIASGLMVVEIGSRVEIYHSLIEVFTLALVSTELLLAFFVMNLIIVIILLKFHHTKKNTPCCSCARRVINLL